MVAQGAERQFKTRSYDILLQFSSLHQMRFLYENYWIFTLISLTFVPNSPIDN